MKLVIFVFVSVVTCVSVFASEKCNARFTEEPGRGLVKFSGTLYFVDRDDGTEVVDIFYDQTFPKMSVRGAGAAKFESAGENTKEIVRVCPQFGITKRLCNSIASVDTIRGWGSEPAILYRAYDKEGKVLFRLAGYALMVSRCF
jgi:hypothetical protein